MMITSESWTFYNYMDADGDNAIIAWLHELPIKAQAKIDGRLLVMLGMRLWPDGWISSLEGYDDIYEIRITCANIQYRPLGCYGPAQREFTLLVGAIEKGGRIPRGTLQSALTRRQIILGDRTRVRKHQFN